MSNDRWPKVDFSTLADQVYEAVRDRILNGELASGEFAREQELSAAMGVSRTPVREALGRLASEGFLERIPRRGFRVPQESVGDLVEFYPIVAALELLVGKLAFPKLTPADLEKLHEINDRLSAAMEAEDVDKAVELNYAFHEAITARTGNERLNELLRDLRAQVHRLERWYYSYPEHTAQSVRQHEELMEALEERDHDRAMEILEHNMELTQEALTAETAFGGPPHEMAREGAAD